MADTVVHRGPDDAGEWLDEDAGILLAHRRLSIVDLTSAGRQPMVSASGRYVLVFNGEIYNHREMRPKVESAGHQPRQWRGHSDTETLLAAIEQWGVVQALQQSVGMFALALWDRHNRSLTLARDRMGEKPLYYGYQSGSLLFGSELKSLRAHPAFRADIDPNALKLYLRYGYVPAPWSIWAGIRKLTPGTLIEFGGDSGALSAPRPYWSLTDAISRGQENPFQGSDEDAVEALEDALRVAIRGQMVADVPLGAFLSGGVDSATVVALMQAGSARPVKTFTIGFEEVRYNEASHARAVAEHLGTEHTELYVTAAQAQGVIPDLPEMYDEPFGDSSAIPTHLVSRLARRDVTVSLSGDGGDELFGGYTRYASVSQRWMRMARVPRALRIAGARALRLGGQSALDPFYWSCGARRGTSLAARMQQWAVNLDTVSSEALYDAAVASWPDAGPVQDGAERRIAGVVEPIERMMATDCLSYLPDDILVKVDRAAMAVSLETRVPLLDHRIVELAWSLPYALKSRGGEEKWLLRQVLYRHVPRSLIERPKMGFGVPVDEWLRGPLREWAENLVDESRLRDQGLIDPTPVLNRWRQHVNGHHNWRDSIWRILMFQAWVDAA